MTSQFFQQGAGKKCSNFIQPTDTKNSPTQTEEHTDLANEVELAVTEMSDRIQVGNKAKLWTGDIKPTQHIDELACQLCQAFNHSPFLQHNAMQMLYVDEQLRCELNSQPFLVGNVAFNILHGGVAATMLDSIGGLEGMLEIYRRNEGSFAEQVKKVGRLATVDIRIDYLSPGRGKVFVATAEVIRMGRKGHTARMILENEQGKKIAAGTAAYAF